MRMTSGETTYPVKRIRINGESNFIRPIELTVIDIGYGCSVFLNITLKFLYNLFKCTGHGKNTPKN